jgi:hypothetical protein
MQNRKNPFKGRQFTAEMILWAVRWYLQFLISYRGLEMMLQGRGVSGDHGKLWESGSGRGYRRWIGWRSKRSSLFGTSMRIEIQLRIVADDDSVISEGQILHFDKGDDRLEVIGLSFDEAKAALAGIQGGVVTAQAASFLARHRSCDLCGSLLLSKGPGPLPYGLRHHRADQSAFSPLPVPAWDDQDLQPAEPAPDRAHRSGTALLGDSLGLAGVLRHDSGFAEGRFADRRYR